MSRQFVYYIQRIPEQRYCDTRLETSQYKPPIHLNPYRRRVANRSSAPCVEVRAEVPFGGSSDVAERTRQPPLLVAHGDG
eukprot:COSAG01_NODE_15022_length_1384_cov_107.796109_2_plen_80_part_00